MINRELEAFITIAKAGSFQKASNQLFLSSPALIKQINALEEETGLKLFRRTNRGLKLTEEGQIFYEASIDILQRYHSAIQLAKESACRNVNPVRIGFSHINPYQSFADLYPFDVSFSSKFTTYMVPISSEYKDFADEMRNLGDDVDVIPYFCGHDGLDAMCKAFCLAKLPLRVAVPMGHPLSGRERLRYDDLNGQKIVCISGEANQYFRAFIADIREKAPKAEFRFVYYYDFALLNYAVARNELILTGGHMKDVHPLLKLLPVEWDHVLPYGLHYSKTPSAAVMELLQAFQDSGLSGSPEDAPVVDL